MARPTKYEPSICDILDSMGGEGEGMAEAIVACGISRDTFYAWQESHPEFSDAVKEMRGRSQAWWEQQGRIATFGGTDGFNATSYVFNMKNRFRDDWNDKTTTELTGKDGDPIKTEEVGTGVPNLLAHLEAIAERSGTSSSSSSE